MISPDQVKWGPGPPSLPAGAELAVLSGDPSKAGSFTMRVKFPAGFKVPPHWHPTDENVVVISGTMLLGEGDKFDEAAAHELPAGSFMVMPKQMRHFAMAKEESIVQIYGTGPFAVNYVNAADDPRKAK
jgi:quercetin dioxygenase-like cupin family protein